MAKEMNAILKQAPTHALPAVTSASTAAWGTMALLSVFFAALVYTYFVIASRRLDYSINRAVVQETRLQNEIAALNLSIGEMETPAALLAARERMELDLTPSEAPFVWWLDPESTEPCPPGQMEIQTLARN